MITSILLRIAVNEDLLGIKVFAVGADTLEIDADRRSTFASGAVMDSIVISTAGLSSPKKDEDDDYPRTTETIMALYHRARI